MVDAFKLSSLLVYLDESPSCAAAVNLGIAWSKQYGALLVGLGVIDEPLIHGPRPDLPVQPSYQATYNQLVAEARHDVDQRLDRFSRRCLEAGVAYKLLEDEGRPGDQLLRESQRYDVLLLGRGSRLGAALGEENIEHFLRRAPRPVIAVPENSVTTGSVVVAYDGSSQAARALQAFLASGLAGLGNVHVLSLHEESAVCAAKTADLAVEFLRFHNVPAVPVSLVGSAAPGNKTLIDKACELSAGLIVMGACGHSRLHDFLFGSRTHCLLRDSGIPLFLYH